MADTGTIGDSLGLYITGARIQDHHQPDFEKSLGGGLSSARVPGLSVHAIHLPGGMEVLRAEDTNGKAICRVRADGLGSFWWAGSDGVEGAETAIAAGETKLVPGNRDDDWCVIRRSSQGGAPAGVGEIQLIEMFNGVVGGRNVSEAERAAGRVERLCVGIRNDNSVALTNIKMIVDSDSTASVQLGWGAGDDNARVAAIHKTTDSPPNVTFGNPTTWGSALSLGTLNAGEAAALWVEITVSAGASGTAYEVVRARIRFDVGGTTYERRLFAGFAIEEDALEGEGVWVGVNGSPDLTAAPDQFFAGSLSTDASTGLQYGPRPLAITAVTLNTNDTYEIYTAVRDKYGLYGAHQGPMKGTWDGTNNLANPPAAPQGLVGVAVEDGKVALNGAYFPNVEADNETDLEAYRATHFAIWFEVDGSPDTSLTADAEVAMGITGAVTSFFPPPPEHLNHETTTQWVENTPVHAAVKTRRKASGIPDVDSETAQEVTVTTRWNGPQMSLGTLGAHPVLKGSAGDHFAMPAELDTDIDDTVTIDAGNSVRLVLRPGRTELWYGSTLGWRAMYRGPGHPDNGFYTGASLEFATVSGSMVGAVSLTQPVEIGTWDGSNKELFIGVDGTRRLKFDFVTNKVTATRLDLATNVADTLGDTGIWARWQESVIMVWDPAGLRWRGVAQVNDSGDLQLDVPFTTRNRFEGEWVSEANDVYYRKEDGFTDLWWNDQLVFRLRRDGNHSNQNGLWTPLKLVIGSVSGAAAATTELGTWDDTAKEIFISQGGTRLLKMDLVAKTLTVNGIQPGQDPVDPTGTLLDVWDAALGTTADAFSLRSDGVLELHGAFRPRIDVGEIP